MLIFGGFNIPYEEKWFLQTIWWTFLFFSIKMISKLLNPVQYFKMVDYEKRFSTRINAWYFYRIKFLNFCLLKNDFTHFCWIFSPPLLSWQINNSSLQKIWRKRVPFFLAGHRSDDALLSDNNFPKAESNKQPFAMKVKRKKTGVWKS